MTLNMVTTDKALILLFARPVITSKMSGNMCCKNVSVFNKMCLHLDVFVFAHTSAAH